jgi:PPIC-type PPIASE domain
MINRTWCSRDTERRGWGFGAAQLALALGLALAGCSGSGDSGPIGSDQGRASRSKAGDQGAGIVARVGDSVIERSVYEKEYRRALAQTAIGAAYTPRRDYDDPPSYRWCVHDRRLSAVGEDRKLTVAEMRDRCRRHIEGRTRWVLEALIEERWLVREAWRVGLETPTRLSPKQQAALRRTVVEKVLSSQDFRPSEEAITAYYAQHGDELAEPQQRDASAMFFPSKELARKASRALAIGAAWGATARKYAQDRAAVKLTKISEEGRDPLIELVFDARDRRPMGPVEADTGVYLVRLARVIPVRRFTRAELHDAISTYLAQRAKAQAALAYIETFLKRSRDITVCLGPKVSRCRNGSSAAYEDLGEGHGWTAPLPMPIRPTFHPAPGS